MGFLLDSLDSRADEMGVPRSQRDWGFIGYIAFGKAARLFASCMFFDLAGGALVLMSIVIEQLPFLLPIRHSATAVPFLHSCHLVLFDAKESFLLDGSCWYGFPAVLGAGSCDYGSAAAYFRWNCHGSSGLGPVSSARWLWHRLALLPCTQRSSVDLSVDGRQAQMDKSCGIQHDSHGSFSAILWDPRLRFLRQQCGTVHSPAAGCDHWPVWRSPGPRERRSFYWRSCWHSPSKLRVRHLPMHCIFEATWMKHEPLEVCFGMFCLAIVFGLYSIYGLIDSVRQQFAM